MNTRTTLSRRDLLKYVGASGLLMAAKPYAWANSAAASPSVTFLDVARPAGITFQHDNAASPEKYLIETMGSGCGWIDYDQNGLLDLYLVNGAATKVYQPARPLRSALYRNNGDGTFADVTTKAGVGAEGLFGMGVAVGLRQRRVPGPLRSWLRPVHSLSQQWRWHLHRLERARRRGEFRPLGLERRLV